MAKVKLIETTEKFVLVLERSQLFAPNQLDAIKKLAETAEDPIQIARALLKNGWVTKWQASQMLSGFYHLTIGKYRLSEQLGKGELGNVYLAENPKLKRKVALKTLSKKFTGDPKLVERFLGEAKAAAALDHRNIVHIHDVTSEGQRHYIVMEYVSGKDLASQIDSDGKLAVEEAVGIVRQVAEGLNYAHGQKVVHRNIKPANIIVDDQGVAKILDIGVGHLRKTNQTGDENTGELMMSALAFMAPEHARGHEVDARGDIYSLGAVLYFLLTGRAPFIAKTDEERAQIKTSGRPLPISELRRDVPQSIVDLCGQMMETKLEDRVALMSDVVSALTGNQGVVSGESANADESDISDAEPAEVEVAEADADGDVIVPAVKTKPAEPEAESKPTGQGFKIDVGDGAKPAASVAPMGFSINTKKRKKKPAPVPKPAAETATAEPAAVEPVAEEPVVEEPVKTAEPTEGAANEQEKPVPATASGEKKPLPKALLIGGAIAGALLLMAGSGVGALMLFGGGEKEVVVATTEAPVTTDEQVEEPPAESDASEAVSSDDSDGAIEPASEAESSTGSDAASPSTTESPDAGTADANPTAEPTSTAAEPGAEVGTPPAASTGSNENMTDDSAAATAEAGPPANTAPAVAATPEKSADEKPPEKKPEPAKQPEPAKPPEKKAPPKPKTFVFKPAVDLPVPEADAPELTLGQINIRPEDAVFISMDGGDIAAGGRFEFSLQNAQDGIAPRDWEFYLSDGVADPIVIATMSMPEKDLKFKWTPAGIENATATNLRNCSLRITAGQDQPQDLSLRTPQKLPPVTIDLEKSATAKLPLEGAPDRSSLKMEITVKGHKFMVEPSQIELGKGGEAIIFFGENQEQAALALKIDASVNARGVQVKTDPYFIVPFEKTPVRLNKASIKKYESVQAQQAGLQAQIFEGQKAVNDKKLSPQQKAQVQGLLAEMKQKLELIDKTVQKMSQLNADMSAIGAGASLQFRVFSDTFEKQIDLIVTDPNAAPVAP